MLNLSTCQHIPAEDPVSRQTQKSQGHHTTNCLEKRGKKKKGQQLSASTVCDRATVNHQKYSSNHLGEMSKKCRGKYAGFPPKERRQIEQAYIQVAIKGAMFSASLQVKIKVIWQFQAGPLSTSAKDRYSSHENPATKAASTSFSISRLSLSLFSSGTMLSMGRSTVFTLFFFFAPPFFSSPFSPTWGKTTKSQISLGRRTGLKLALENA